MKAKIGFEPKLKHVRQTNNSQTAHIDEGTPSYLEPIVWDEFETDGDSFYVSQPRRNHLLGGFISFGARRRLQHQIQHIRTKIRSFAITEDQLFDELFKSNINRPSGPLGIGKY